MKCNMSIDSLILFTSAIFDKDSMWSILNSFNALMKVDCKTGQVVDAIPVNYKEKVYDCKLITSFLHNNAMFYLRSGKNELIKQEISTQKIEFLLLPPFEGNVKEAIFCKGYLCLFMSDVRNVVVIDVESQSIKMKINLDGLEVLEEKKNWSMFWKPFAYKEKVYVACQNTRCFLTIDLQAKNWYLTEKTELVDGVQDVFVTDENRYVLGVNGCIEKENISTGIGMLISSPDNEECQYSRIIYLNNRVWLLPAYSNDICVVSEEGRKETIFSFPSEVRGDELKTITNSYSINNEYIYVYPCSVNFIIQINTNTGECKKIDLAFSKKVREKLTDSTMYSFEFMEGKRNFNNISLQLSEYIDLISLQE